MHDVFEPGVYALERRGHVGSYPFNTKRSFSALKWTRLYCRIRQHAYPPTRGCSNAFPLVDIHENVRPLTAYL